MPGLACASALAGRYRTEPTTNRFALGPKQVLAQRLGRSPDSMDATVMAFAHELLSPCTVGGAVAQIL